MAEENTSVSKKTIAGSRKTALPAKIGGYKPTQLLGKGAMGNVWLCHDPSLDRMVVVKQMLPLLLNQDDFILRFEREARILAHLNHPAIVVPYALWKEKDGQLSLSMEFVQGRSLRELLDNCKQPPVWVVMSILYDLLNVLSVVHNHGIVHRDLKPANLMIDKDGRFRLLDFGVAHEDKKFEEDVTLTIPGSQIGTGAYMSPEQTVNAQATPASDLFSVGIIASEMLLGENVFRGQNLEQTFKNIQKMVIKPEAFDERVPMPLRKLVIRLLSKKPAKRPLSAADAADELSKMMRAYPRDLMPYISEWVNATMQQKDCGINPVLYPDTRKKLFLWGLSLGAVVVTAISIFIHFI